MLNLEKLYSQGCAPFLASTQHADRLIELMRKDSWQEDPSGMYRRLPTWHPVLDDDPDMLQREKTMIQAMKKQAPPEYAQTIEAMLNCPSVIGNLMVFGGFQVDFVHCWEGAEDLDWHWDGVAQSPFFLMFYGNDDREWMPEWGGSFSFGEKNLLLQPNWLVDSRNVKIHGEVFPVYGQAILCWNQNPRFVHKVTPLNTQKARWTLTAGLSFKK